MNECALTKFTRFAREIDKQTKNQTTRTKNVAQSIEVDASKNQIDKVFFTLDNCRLKFEKKNPTDLCVLFA